MVDWIGADVEKNSEHRTRPGKVLFGQDHSKSGRQHPAADELAGLIGHPYFGEIMQEIHRLQVYDIEPTREMVTKAVEIVNRRVRPHHAVLPPTTVDVQPFAPVGYGRFHTIPDVGDVVYYMRIGDRVKIGMTTNLRSRLEAINPEELLAIEKGGRTVEAARHKQFADLHTHGEWFRLEGVLVEHIERLRSTE
jgi:hypothetical protein